jgi:hypothetical protein
VGTGAQLCALERPGGGGRSHRTERRTGEIAYLKRRRVRLVVSVMRTRHNLSAYDEAGLEWHHVPVRSVGEGGEALEELLRFLRRELRSRGALAVHGDSRTDFAAALCAAHLHEVNGEDPAQALAAAATAGLTISPEACALVGVELDAVQAGIKRG